MSDERRLMQFYFITKSEVSAHYHQNPEMFYILAGNLEVKIDEQEFHLKAGDIILINANKRHLVNGDDSLLAARFEIDFHVLAEHMETMQLLFWCNTVADKNDAYQELRSLLDQILARYFEKEEKSALHLNALYYETAYLLTSNFLVKTDDARVYLENTQDKQRIRQIQNYIQANYQSEISLNDLAGRLFLSNAYLSRYVKKHLGLTFMEYLNNVRLFHAVDELLYTQKNMTHIALDNGFPTSAAFTKAFRDVYGVAPSEYRKEIRKQEGVEDPRQNLSEEELKLAQRYLELRKEDQEPEAKAVKTVVIDTKEEGTKLSHSYKNICIGEAYKILQSDVQNQIKELKESTGIQYARIWNIFSREECFNEKEGCNFRKMDMVLDFLLENDIKPYIELGHKETVFLYTPERSLKPSEEAKQYSIEIFQQIMSEFTMHLVNRYGLEEIEKWYFEMWNSDKDDMESNLYFSYFDSAYEKLKEISSRIQVGGAGFILGYETRQCLRILERWKDRKITPDFLSVYSYQYTSVFEGDSRYGRKSIDRNYMKNQMEIMKDVIAESGIEIPKIHISEWNFTISNRNLLHDSCEQGAYVLKNCIDMNGEVDMMAYWHALDNYSDYYDADEILNGDSGMISRDGILKPSFYAYTFMNHLLPEVLYKDENSIVTTNGRGHYVIACHNFKKLSAQYVFKDEDQITVDEIDNYVEDSEPLKLSFHLKNVKSGAYLVKTHLVNRENGSAQDIWKRLEYGKNLTKDEMRYLRKSAIPRMEMNHVQVHNDVLEIDCMLMEQEIRLLDIRYHYTAH
ncbi:MAG: helix-turn-helix domain-containing protein [Hespellia sp.]|nr:helix-turn-helix domain-containing protein [Hespellia sp.]